MSIYNGIAGRRGGAARGVVIHNDAGSQNATPNFYRGWLPTRNPELGFAHVYISADDRLQAEDYENCAWHVGEATGNYWYVGWEVCQSDGDEATVRANEQACFKDVANYMKSVGMVPNASTVKLHREFSSTSCPRRSVELHGGTLESTRAYFIQEIQKYMGGASVPTPEKPSKPAPSKPTPAPSNDVDYMRKYGYVIWNGKQFKVDDRSKFGGIWQVVSNELSGLTPSATTSDQEWINNGVAMSGIDWTDGTPQSSTQGNRFKFKEDRMNIVGYDVPSNGIAVMVGGHKLWVDATVAKNA